MGQLNPGFSEDTKPSDSGRAGDKIDLEMPPGFPWLTFFLVVAMIGSFGVVWFLSTPR